MFMRLCGLDFTSVACASASAVHTLPMLKAGSQLLPVPELYAFLRQQGHDLDAELTRPQRADSLAYVALTEEHLGLALLFSWWAETDNYESVVRPAYAARLPLPLCYYYPWTLRRRALSQLARRGAMHAEATYQAGEEALAALAARLGERPFFHGDTPAAVDASIFAYLSAVLRCPLPNDRWLPARHPAQWPSSSHGRHSAGFGAPCGNTRIWCGTSSACTIDSSMDRRRFLRRRRCRL